MKIFSASLAAVAALVICYASLPAYADSDAFVDDDASVLDVPFSRDDCAETLRLIDIRYFDTLEVRYCFCDTMQLGYPADLVTTICKPDRTPDEFPELDEDMQPDAGVDVHSDTAPHEEPEPIEDVW